MSLSHQHADDILEAAYITPATPFVQLHTGSPGSDGTANIAADGGGSAARKAIAFAAVSNHPSNTERRVLSDGEVSWSGSEIDASQTITHASLWDAVTSGNLLDVSSLSESKVVGSDGVTIADGAVEVALTVFVKP